MENINKEDVLEVANWTRRFLEELQAEKNVFYDGLAGACGIGALLNYRLLDYVLGLNASDFVMSRGYDGGHCWTEIILNGEQYALDVTATQFDRFLPKVILEPREDYEKHDFHRYISGEVWYNEEAIRMFKMWTSRQTPWAYDREIKQAFPEVVDCVCALPTSEW